MRDPLAPVRVVSITDPAYLMTPEQRGAYAVSRDPSMLPPPRVGFTPCVFVVGPVSAEAAIRLDALDQANRYILSFLACVHSVELPSGEILTAKTKPAGVYGDLASEDWIQVVGSRVGPRRVAEIGEAAYRLSMLDDSDPLLPSPGQPPPS